MHLKTWPELEGHVMPIFLYLCRTSDTFEAEANHLLPNRCVLTKPLHWKIHVIMVCVCVGWTPVFVVAILAERNTFVFSPQLSTRLLFLCCLLKQAVLLAVTFTLT